MCLKCIPCHYIIKNQLQTSSYFLIFIYQQHHIQAIRSESLWYCCISVKQHLQKGNTDVIKYSLFMFHTFKLTWKQPLSTNTLQFIRCGDIVHSLTCLSVSSSVHAVHHLSAHQVVQQLQGVLLHPDGEVRPACSDWRSGRREGSDCGERIRTLQSSQHALQQSQWLPGNWYCTLQFMFLICCKILSLS